jgi:hypothetical protein
MSRSDVYIGRCVIGAGQSASILRMPLAMTHFSLHLRGSAKNNLYMPIVHKTIVHMGAYARDKAGIIWPLIIWPYGLHVEGQLSKNDRVLKLLSLLDEYFGKGFGIYILDRGFDRFNLIEPFLASKRHPFDSLGWARDKFAQDRFIIRQGGDRAVILENGVRMILRDLVEHLFADSGDWLVYRKVYLQGVDDAVPYCRQPRSFWFYRISIALHDAFNRRAQMSLLRWCRLPP